MPCNLIYLIVPIEAIILGDLSQEKVAYNTKSLRKEQEIG
jgi:hypothetical protein